MLEPRFTIEGTLESVVEPSPNCPSELSPQHFIEAVTKTTQVCFNPKDTEIGISEPKSTSTGVDESNIVPSPNCPSELSPQHFKLASSRIAHVCPCPAEIEIAVRPIPKSTAVIVWRCTVVPSPNCPLELSPQQLIEESSSIAQT